MIWCILQLIRIFYILELCYLLYFQALKLTYFCKIFPTLLTIKYEWHSLISCFSDCTGWLSSAVYIMECPLCSRGFKNKFNLKVHMRDVHGDDQGPFLCPRCGKQVKNRSCLRVHLYRRHQALRNIPHPPVTLHKTK